MRYAIQTFLTSAGIWTARPAAFGFVLAYVVLWLIFDRESFNFHGFISVITLCMTLFIKRSEHRDTQAIQAKLDELLRASDDARSGLTHQIKSNLSRSKLIAQKHERMKQPSLKCGDPE